MSSSTKQPYNMNPIYHIAEALVEYVKSQASSEATYLHKLAMMDNWQHELQLSYNDNPMSWRLMKSSVEGDNTSTDEIVFTIQGFIIEKSLPPVRTAPRLLDTQPYLLEQRISISGLNTPTFERSVSALLDLFPVLVRQFPDGQFDSFQFGNCPVTDGRVVSFSNRYFTRKKDAPGLTPAPFPTQVDPLGILKGKLSSALIHTQENDVEYYIQLTDSDGTKKFRSTSPQTFRIGDLVKVQFSLVVFQKLRSLPTFRMILKQLLSNPAYPLTPVKRSKRRVGYEIEQPSSPEKHVCFDDEEMEEAEHDSSINKLQNMSLGPS
ncbi:hypothetical protein BDN72DRAFT_905154 [Pluteus cervinus]|uniref:Uncharacterized protein n=1 Tax=Pluteus cervinus TaxID=181527 RepID=A0ACD3A3J4_9AGAR|nr:hypothetical protein BDN72DRAFT_905154 [Pluteus cervinus]